MKNSNAFALACALDVAAGCSSIKIKSPANGSQNLNTPQQLVIDRQGQFGPLSITVDGRDCQHINGQNWDFTGSPPMYFLDPGSHSILVSGVDSGGTTRSDTSSFSIASCPTCYQCPGGGYVHPILGQCCTGSTCDDRVAENFGPTYFNFCTVLQPNDCINQNALAICGGTAGSNCGGIPTGSPQAVALQFSPSRPGALSQVQLPIGHLAGTNSYVVAITTDNAGVPGTALETFNLTNLRAQHFPTQAPAHLFSSTHPNLTAGTKYWIVVAPGASDTAGSWNFAPTDTPVTQPANFLANTTAGANGVPTLAGPWSGSSLGPLRTAFEIDVR